MAPNPLLRLHNTGERRQNEPFARHTFDAFLIMERGRVLADRPIADMSEALVQHYLTA